MIVAATLVSARSSGRHILPFLFFNLAVVAFVACGATAISYLSSLAAFDTLCAHTQPFFFFTPCHAPSTPRCLRCHSICLLFGLSNMLDSLGNLLIFMLCCTVAIGNINKLFYLLCTAMCGSSTVVKHSEVQN